MEQATGHTKTSAYAFIREKILSGDLPPGKALTTLDLSKQIGVSRTPVRDALRQLEGEGLVTILPDVGATVKSLSSAEFRQLCCIRLALESYAAGEAARIRRSSDLRDLELHFNLMKEQCEKMKDAGRNVLSNSKLLSRHDICFHLAIAEATSNELLKREITRLCIVNRFVGSDGVRRDWETYQHTEENLVDCLDRVVAEHKDILEAVRAEEVVTARSLMERHIQNIIDSFDRTSLIEQQKRLQASLRI